MTSSTTAEEEVEKIKSKYSFEEHLEFAGNQKGIKLPEVYAEKAEKATEPGHIRRVDAAYERWHSTQKKNVSATVAALPGELVPDLLEEFLRAIRKTMNQDSFGHWFAGIREMSRVGKTVYLRAPSETVKECIAYNYGDLVEVALEEIGLGGFKAEFLV